jgi:transcription initiation factor TFIID subunit 8
LKSLPSYFPDLPPKHTYLQTPVSFFHTYLTCSTILNLFLQASPPKKAALPSLEKKLKTAALVQESLQSLLLATEDTMNQEDGELLGHIVNWEMSTQLRKRWKVGTK